MINLNGYIPLSQYYRMSVNSIEQKLKPVMEQTREIVEKKQKEDDILIKANREAFMRGEEPVNYIEPTNDYRLKASQNTMIAARLLAYDLIYQNEMFATNSQLSLSIYSPTGHLTPISASIIRPPNITKRGEFSRLKREAEISGQMSRYERFFGIPSLSLDFWMKPFLNEYVFYYTNPNDKKRFRSSGIPEISIVDWDLGCICISELAAYVKALALLFDAVNSFEIAGYAPLSNKLEPSNIRQLFFQSQAILKGVEAYDGQQILVPTSWTNEPIGPVEPTQEQPDSLRPSFELILKIIDEFPDATKAEVRDHFPSMATREFNRQWERAAEINPEIRKPGRRRPKS